MGRDQFRGGDSVEGARPSGCLPPAVADAARRLSRRSAVRRAVEALAETDSDAAFAELITALNPKVRRRRAERMVASMALPSSCHTPERRADAVVALAAAARQEHLLGSRLTTGRLGRAYTVIGIAAPSTLLVCAVASWALYWWDLPYQFLLVPVILAFPGTIAIGAVSIGMSLSKERAACLVVKAVEGLAALGAAEALDAIVEQLAFPTTTPVQPAAARAIATIAERVTSEHYGVIPKSALAAICRRSKLLTDERVVRMLGEAGGLEVLPAIERLASSGRPSPARDVARTYLAAVRDRAAKERDAGILLRPAEVAPESTLLRPVSGGPAETGLLVRPSSDPDPADR
ncbi:MAG: hypothetical protein FJX72_16455 [Armatimonadetes bacterium]|nr:hypothetical protein [Armatimonadota bacterium]